MTGKRPGTDLQEAAEPGNNLAVDISRGGGLWSEEGDLGDVESH